MAFIPVDVDLDGSYAPPLMNSFGVLLKVGHCGVRFDVNDTLTDGTAAVTLLRFSTFGDIWHLLLLHLAPGFLLH